MAPSHEQLERAVQIAEAQWARGELLAALGSYRALLLARLAGQRAHPAATTLAAADLVIIERLADLAVLCGQFDAAATLLGSMSDLCRRAGNIYGADYAALKHLQVMLGKGELQQAYGLLRALQPTLGDPRAIRFTPAGLLAWEAERRWPGTSLDDRAVLFSRFYLVAGSLLAALGQFGDALAALQRGLAHTGAAAPQLASQAETPLRLGLAAAHIAAGALDAGGAQLRQLAGAIDERRQPGFRARWLELDGKAALLRGAFGDALDRLAEVRELCQRFGLVAAELRATLNLAHALIYLNQTARALDLLGEADAMAGTAGDPWLQQRLHKLRDLAFARGHSLADGVPIAPSVSELWGAARPGSKPRRLAATADRPADTGQPADYLTFFEDRALEFVRLLGEADLAEAVAYLSHLQRVFAATDSQLIRVRLQVLGAMLAYYQDRPAEALAAFEPVRTQLRAMGLRPDLWQVQRFLGWCLAQLGDGAPEQQALSEENDQLLAAMTRSLPASARAIFLLNKWTAEEESFATEINRLAELKRQLAASHPLLRPFRRWALMRHLSALQQRIDFYKDALARREIGGAQRLTATPAARALWWRLLRHPRDRATVSFLVLPDRVLITRTAWCSLDFGVSPTTRLQLRALVRTWHEQVAARAHASSLAPRGLFLLPDDEQAPDADATSSCRSIAAQIASSLQLDTTLGSLPRRIHKLTLVPDDSLHGFPFAALPAGAQYLCERYALTIAFEREAGRRAPPPRAPRQALLVGVSRGAQQFPPLQGVLHELSHVEAHLRGQHTTRILLDDAASRTMVLAALPDAALLHIAAHGIFMADKPDHSGIVLIPRPGQVELLSLHDLAGLTLNGLGHVTLSSCWAADQFVLPGRWVISLPETLWRAGARSVLGSLWEVHDQLAVAFMDRFYSYLAAFPAEDALQRTQRDCLHGRLPGYDRQQTGDLFVWSGFQLYGDGRGASTAQGPAGAELAVEDEHT